MSNDTQVATERWLKWAWRYASLTVDEFDTYDEAITAAYYASEAGEESLECIEGPQGCIDGDVVESDLAAQSRATRQRADGAPKSTHGIRLKSPDGKTEAWYSQFYNQADAEREAERLRTQWGADRVRLFPLP